MKRLYHSLLSTIHTTSKPRLTEPPPSPAPNPSGPSPHGLHLIHSGTNPTVDIIAIHGLNGHPHRSWTHPPTGTCWLQDLLPDDVPETRILSYGWDASKSSTRPIEEVAAALVTEIRTLRWEEQASSRPIIFLAHSFGGPLLKGALAHDDDGRIQRATYGILFFGVPRHGIHGFNHLASAATINGNGAAAANESPLMKAYRRDLAWLRDSNGAFEGIEEGFVTRYFVESAGEASAPGDDRGEGILGDNVVFLGKTHGQMIKFPDGDDADYRKVKKCLAQMVEDATGKGVGGG